MNCLFDFVNRIVSCVHFLNNIDVLLYYFEDVQFCSILYSMAWVK